MVLVVSKCAASYLMERGSKGASLAILFFDFLCHTFYDYKPHADLDVGMRTKISEKTDAIPYEKRTPLRLDYWYEYQSSKV